MLRFKRTAGIAVFSATVARTGRFCYTINRGGAMIQENTVATWICLLHLARPEAVSSPTEEESAAIDCHFARLRQACSTGAVRLAGPATDGAFGIVIFEATDEAAADSFMAEDPAVRAGVMTAELHPFRISLEHPPCI
ncbi:MAG: YciI family protein [Candidatus Cryosericum sp.]